MGTAYRNNWILFCSAIVISIMAGFKGFVQVAHAASTTEIKVKLLGQPCVLQGPYDELTLKKVHAIGPAQIYPTFSVSELKNSKNRTLQSLNQLKHFKNLPPLFDGYQKHLIKRMEDQVALLNGLESYQETHQSQPLFEIARSRVRQKSLEKFENLLKKMDSLPSKNTLQYRNIMDQLMDSYNEGIEPDPEQEFHRAIKKLKIKYICSFEEPDDPTDESSNQSE